jgi:glycosyltransferase involved in cell wall biosynthesis
MTILSVAYPLLPVGPDSGGGAEQILYVLERGLVRRGCRSIVIAAKGSQVSGELIETPVANGEITEQVRATARREHLCCIQQALSRYSIDLIHFHGLDFYEYLPVSGFRQLATLHLPPAWYPPNIFDLEHVVLNCVSESQASAAPSRKKLPVVSNGIDTELYRVSAREKTHLMWLGRICPEKGVHIGLEVARELDIPMVIAGPVHPFHEHELYFRERVQPLLDSQRRYVGPVGLDQKKALFAEAKCVLIPSLVAETSSLVAMESISCGTPVVAFSSGALPEIVEHGVTGFIVDSADEMKDAVTRIDGISPERCHERAELRFSASRMVDDYLKVYDSL